MLPVASSELSREESVYYSRHLIMPEVGVAGQRKLRDAKVLIVGAGGLGSPVALYLAAAGIGTLGVLDFDDVAVSNLHRQVLFNADDAGRRKVDAAADRLRQLNPNVTIIPQHVRLDGDNVLETIKPYDVVVDATDNFPARYLINDACVIAKKPDVFASIFRFDGTVSVFWADRGPCYRCAFPEPPEAGMVPSCAEGGVLGVLPGIVGSIQANEVLKIVLGIGQPLVGSLFLFDCLSMSTRILEIGKDDACQTCKDGGRAAKLVDYYDFCGVPRLGPYDEAVFQGVTEITVHDLKGILDRHEPITLIDVRPAEYASGAIPSAVSIPFEQIDAHFSEFAFDTRLICYCQSGVVSAMAARRLRDAGFAEVSSLRGGLDAWYAD